MAKIMKKTFAGGELAPELDGRVDLERYDTSAAFVSNFLIDRFGNASNVPGTHYIADAASAYTKLVPFSFGAGQRYMLEFGEKTMRVFRDGALQTYSIRTAAYKWTLSASGTNEWYLEDVAGGDPGVVTSVIIPQQVTEKIADALGSATTRTRFMKEGTIGSLAAGEWVVGDNDSLGFNTPYVRLSDSADPNGKAADWLHTDYQLDISALVPAVTTTHWAEGMDYTQSYDVLYLTNSNFAPIKITRTGDTSWTAIAQSRTPTATAIDDTYVTTTLNALHVGTGNTRNIYYKVSSIDSTQSESAASDDILTTPDTPWPDGGLAAIFWNNLCWGGTSTLKWTQSAAVGNEYHLEAFAGGNPGLVEPATLYEDYTEMTAGTVGSLAVGEWDFGDNDSLGYNTIYVRITGSVDPDTKAAGYLLFKRTVDNLYNVYKNMRGFYGLLETTDRPWCVDDNEIVPNVEYAPIITDDPFGANPDAPKAVSLYQQRLCLGRTDDEPQIVEFSQTGRFDDFSNRFPSIASDSFGARLDTDQLEEVLWLLSAKKLLVFTGESLWTADHGDNSDALAPDNIQYRHQEFVGCSRTVRPVSAAGDIVYAQGDDKRLYGANFTFEVDGYTTQELTVLVPHLFSSGTIVDMTYQRFPNSIIWCAMSDGTVVTLTYVRAQQIWAFTRVDFGGKVKALSSITEDNLSRLYLNMEREDADGNSFYTVEWLDHRNFTKARDAFFVSGGATYERSTTVASVTPSLSQILVTVDGVHGLSVDDKVIFYDVEGITAVSTSPLITEYSTFAGKWWKVASTPTTGTLTLKALDDTVATSAHFTGSVTNPSVGTSHKGVTTLSDLHHLEGLTVNALCDGEVVSGLTVSSGAITLPSYYAVVHVGEAMTADLKTLRLAGGGANRLQGDKKAIQNVIVRCRNSILDQMGYVDETLYPVKQRQYEDWRKHTDLFTGDIEVPLDSTWGLDGQIYYKHEQPTPVTICALIYQVV